MRENIIVDKSEDFAVRIVRLFPSGTPQDTFLCQLADSLIQRYRISLTYASKSATF